MTNCTTKLGILFGSIALALSAAPLSAAAPSSGNKPADKSTVERFGDRIYDEFQGMQQRMEKLFRDATNNLGDRNDWFGGNEYSSSVRFSEENGNYVVRLSLPDRDMKNVDVTVDNNKTLHVLAKEEAKQESSPTTKSGKKEGTATTYELGRYEQLLTLPGPVDASKMKIDRSGTTLTITLPKKE